MATVDFLARTAGLFVRRGFLDEGECRRLRQELQSLTGAPARISQDAPHVDESVRRVKRFDVPESSSAAVAERLLSLKPALEAHFHLSLGICQPLQFLCYHEGYFYQLHRDINSEPDTPEFLKGRRVSVVVFLNSEAEEANEDHYTGGTLTIYGLFEEPGWEKLGFPVKGEAGMLVAFPSQLMHEVQPVKCGSRYTIVSWILGATEEGARS